MTYGRSPYYQQLYNRGIMYLNSGDYERALDAFEDARNVWDNSYAYSGMGRAYYGMGMYEEALDNFETAYSMYSGNLQAAHWRAKALGRLGRYDEAAYQFESVLNMLRNGPINFQQEVLADYEEMKDEMDGIAQIIRPAVDNSIKVDDDDEDDEDDELGDLLIRDYLKKQNETRIIRKGLFSYQCSECGGKVRPKDLFCKKCGRRIT